MPRILVDADACPVKGEVYRVAERYGWGVVLASSEWIRVPPEPWIDLQVVKDEGKLDAVDDWIVEHLGSHDVVVTEDVHLARRCLEGGAYVLSPRGRVFDDSSIGEAVAKRDLLEDLRQAGEITGGPPPFSKRDRSTFLQRLDETVQKARRTLD